MKKTLIVFIMLSVSIFLVGCSDTEKEVQSSKETSNEATTETVTKVTNEKDILKSNIITSFTTDMDEPESAISEENYKKYNEIMDYLNKYPTKEEDVLFKELESVYDQSSDELSDFINANMQNAIAYDSGKTINNVTLEESDIKVNIKVFFNENVKNIDLLDIDPDQADVQITNLRSISKGEFSYGTSKFNYIIKIEYTGDFQEVNVFQLKINEINIDLD